MDVPTVKRMDDLTVKASDSDSADVEEKLIEYERKVGTS